MRVGINFAEALRQSERTFARSHRFNFGDLIWKSLLPVAANRNIGIPAYAPSGFPTRLLQRPQPLHQRSKTPLGTQTVKVCVPRQGPNNPPLCHGVSTGSRGTDLPRTRET